MNIRMGICLFILVILRLFNTSYASSQGFANPDWRWFAADTKNTTDVLNGPLKFTICWNLGEPIKMQENRADRVLVYSWDLTGYKTTIENAAKAWGSVVQMEFQFTNSCSDADAEIVLTGGKSGDFLGYVSVEDGMSGKFSQIPRPDGKKRAVISLVPYYLVPSSIKILSTNQDVSDEYFWYYAYKSLNEKGEPEIIEPAYPDKYWATMTKTERQAVQYDWLKWAAIHEFGHFLGIAHEHARPDAKPLLKEDVTDAEGMLGISTYDPYSVMHHNAIENNYTKTKVWKPITELTCTDVQTIRFMYNSKSNSAYTNCEFDCKTTNIYYLKPGSGPPETRWGLWKTAQVPNTLHWTTMECKQDPPLPADADKDGIPDSQDNCPTTYNPKQENSDGDQLGSACDDEVLDKDGDGVADADDNCPVDHNENQRDWNGNNIGDYCDVNDNKKGDFDNDKIENIDDQCPQTPFGATRVDAYGCDASEGSLDFDGDGVRNVYDECPYSPIGKEVNYWGCPIVKRLPKQPISSAPESSTPSSGANGCYHSWRLKYYVLPVYRNICPSEAPAGIGIKPPIPAIKILLLD